MAFVCVCGCRMELSADQCRRLVASGEHVTCPQCGKQSKPVAKAARKNVQGAQEANASTPSVAIEDLLGMNAVSEPIASSSTERSQKAEVETVSESITRASPLAVVKGWAVTAGRKLPQYVPILTMTVGGVSWLWTLFRPPSPQVLVHYAGLVTFCCGIGFWLSQRAPARARLIAVATIGLIGFVWWSWLRFDCYDRYWKSETGTQFVDTHMRSGDRHVYRMMLPQGGGLIRGPMSGSGKPHGEWTDWFPGERVQHKWYWYGEEITEGEWHIRKK